MDEQSDVNLQIIINLNYMSLNNSLSMESKNQFIPSAPKNNPPNFDTFMQACFTNPSFFQSMKSFYMAQNQISEQQNLNNYQHSGLMNQSNHQSQPNLNNQSRFQPDMQDSRSQYCQKEINVTNSRTTDMKRKPANPLSKYYPTDNIQSQKISEPQTKQITVPTKSISFDQRPIKTNYTPTASNNSKDFDINAIKQNQSINVDNLTKKIRNFDDMPIKGMKDFQIESNYKKQQIKSKPIVYQNEDQRPIKALTTDFKTFVKQQFPNAPFQEEEKQDASELENKSTQPRTFLKRGSRQHLSSAANRSKQPKNNLDSSLNKSQVDQQKERSITPRKNQPQNRGISQNRVLGKRNGNGQVKSISKPQKKNEQSDQEKIVKPRPPLAKEKPKNEYKIAKTNDRVQTVPVVRNDKKKKVKNVFNDDSESEVESEQDVPYFKGNNKKSYEPNRSMKEDHSDIQDKIQVIDGVFLTKEQLEQIVEKYGQVKQIPRQTEYEKVVSLRKKYNQMIALKDQEMEKNRQDLQRKKQQFQRYKTQQMTKLKNERKVMERQVRGGGASGSNMQKEKQQLQNLKQEIEKQRQDFRRKQKNSKIILQKYKKQNQELKSKLDRLEIERENNNNFGSRRNLANTKSDQALQERGNKSQVGSTKGKKVEQQPKNDQISYKDIKKQNKPPINQTKQMKPKYEYVEQQPLKNKSISVKNDKKQVKIQNKWSSHRFNSDSDNSESDKDEQNGGDEIAAQRLNEWSPTMKISDLSKIKLSIKMVNQQMISSLFRYQRNLQYVKYMQSVNSPNRTVVNSSRNNTNSFTAKLYSDRSKELLYDNGTRKVTCENGFSIVYFKNGDIKQTLPDKTVYYYFKEKEVDQITLPNGVNVLVHLCKIYRFENNQVQFHFQNGYIEIRHPDGTIKVLGSQHLRR